MTTALRLMIVAGEASGDLHASQLVRELKRRAPDLEVFGLGGEAMASAGVEVVQNLVNHAVIGFTEAVWKLGDFFKILRRAGELLRERRPGLLVVVDLPDLNFRIAARARALGIPVVYYISPQVWAWRAGRVKTLKRLVDRMIVIFPFEEPIYRKAGVPVTFVGHPLVDLARPEIPVSRARERLLGKSPGPLIGLVPGSRSQEIERLLPVLCGAARLLEKEFPDAKFFLPLAPTIARGRVEEIVAAYSLDVAIITREPMACRGAADVAIVSSGTATLETALLGVPMVIVYRMHPLSYWLARFFIKVEYIGLANLAAGEKIAPELLQSECTPRSVADAAGELLRNAGAAQRQRREWKEMAGRLGGPGAAGRAAETILQRMRG